MAFYAMGCSVEKTVTTTKTETHTDADGNTTGSTTTTNKDGEVTTETTTEEINESADEAAEELEVFEKVPLLIDINVVDSTGEGVEFTNIELPTENNDEITILLEHDETDDSYYGYVVE